LLRVVAGHEDGLEVEAAAPQPPCHMERALQARAEDLPRLLRTFEKRVPAEPGNQDLAEAVVHLRTVARALAPDRPTPPRPAPPRPAPVATPAPRGKTRLVLVGLAAGLAMVGATLLVAAGPLAHRSPADAAPAAAPTRTALSGPPEMELSRGEPVAANALKVLAKFPRAAGYAAGGPCAGDNQVMFASRALAKRIAAPLLGASEAGGATASEWNTLILMARLLHNAERAQARAQAAGCAMAS
jgi:hypothetical protein